MVALFQIQGEKMEIKVTEVEAAVVKQWVEEGKAIVVDVREVKEHRKERIEDAYLVPSSTFDPENVPEQEGKIVVFHCYSGGGRSNRAAAKWARSKNKAEAFHLKGGIKEWKLEGLPTIRNESLLMSGLKNAVVIAVILLAAYLLWSMLT